MRDRERLILLISVEYTADAIGQRIPTETYRKVFARLRSVSLNEWTNANQLGLSASLQAIMWSHEYRGEETVDIDGRRYHVYRTYETAGDRIELYLEEMVGHES